MFGLLINPIVNALDVVDGVFSGEGPTKRQVAKLIDDGVTIAAIAAGFGVAVEVIEALVEER